MSISVQYLLVKENLCFEDISPYICFVSSERQERIRKFLFDQDKITSLIAGLLIRAESCRRLGISHQEVIFSYNSFGKPYLQNYPEFEFSVSHSGRCIAFASDSAPIGIDTEKLSDPDLAIAEHYFTPGELSYVMAGADKSTAFYNIWTKKEAYIKMLGTGLSTPLTSFDVTEDERKKTFRSQQISGYIINVCSDSFKDTAASVTFQELELSDLLKAYVG